MTLPIVILASGRGSNFEAIARAAKSGACDVEIRGLLTDNPRAPALAIAQRYGVPAFVVPRADYASRDDFDAAMFSKISSLKPTLIVLAGYMRLLRDPRYFSHYEKRILNIHPSLLPKYPGAHAQADAFSAHEKISGLTIHLVDESLDGGRILYQRAVDISDCPSADAVSARILEQEHIAYPHVLHQISRGLLKI